LAQAETIGETRVVAAVVPQATNETLKHLSAAIRGKLREGVIALAGVDDGTVSLLVTASDDAVQRGVNAGNLVKLAAPLVGGRGGGAPGQGQGGGKDTAGAAAALAAIRNALAG
jgi:alanyl-tRNA synthetase